MESLFLPSYSQFFFLITNYQVTNYQRVLFLYQRTQQISNLILLQSHILRQKHQIVSQIFIKKRIKRMGNEQPKKLTRVNKTQIQVASMKSKYHLQLMLGRKNAQIIKAEKQLVAKIKSPSRNKVEEILIAERIINALKYAQACNYLMSYCASLKPQANYIAQNMFNSEKLKPYLGMIYSLIYAAQTMGLSSLKQFRDLMRALNDPQTLQLYVNKEIIDLLSPHPSTVELNQYFLEMSERNSIPLEQINIIGHKFTNNIDIKPSNQPTFSELQRKIADQLSKNINNGGQNNQGQGQGQGQNWNNEGQNGQNWNGGQYGPNGQGQGWSGNNLGPNGQGWSGNYVPSNQGWNNQGFQPGQQGNQWQGGMNIPVGDTGNNYITPGLSKPVDVGPDFYTPAKIQPSKDLPSPYVMPQQSKMSIKDINDIVYYPEVPQSTYKVDSDFNALCEKIKVGL